MKSVKCVAVGNVESKKTEMLYTYTTQQWQKHFDPTFHNYSCNYQLDGDYIGLSLWDTAGQEDYDRLRPLSYPNTNIFLICFSIANQKSFESIKNKWIPELKEHAPNVPFILVGTQLEKRDNPKTINKLKEKGLSPITYQQGFELAKEINSFKYLECSARNKVNINEVIEEAVRAAQNQTMSKKQLKKKEREQLKKKQKEEKLKKKEELKKKKEEEKKKKQEEKKKK
ncbi:hypothetical protein M0811_03443 [Anaeramoeba ignava]|uniref:Rho GTPase n=1 Tax=Anaeramoeba ignava TaxID=1746090 RepID=A0A9Q0L7A4_ANAIG|nr:hypothetical protein M0811_03443 [Anaeramoeba ignava]